MGFLCFHVLAKFKTWKLPACTHNRRIKHLRTIFDCLGDYCEGAPRRTEQQNRAIQRPACGSGNKDDLTTAILFHCGKLDLMPNLES